MANQNFRNPKLRKLFEADGLIKNASLDDLSLCIALCRNFVREAILRAEHMAQSDDVKLDPLPAKSTPQDDGEAEG